MKKTVLVGVTSGIAAFKAVSLVKSLSKRYNVVVIMTSHAKRMINPSEFEKASGNKVASELFPKGFDYKKVLKERKVEHISLADKASVICVVPATANIIAKAANGIADDLLTTTILASRATLLFGPAMNCNMWNNKKTMRNILKLKKGGAFFVEPESGMLACGYEGKGRLANIKKFEREIDKLVEKRSELAGKKVIVTAGGTSEEIDDVRLISNKSSGRMGIAIAEELVKRGADVTLVRARTEVFPSVMVKEIGVGSAKQMFDTLKKEVKKADLLVHAAAVSDFTVKKRKGKISSGDVLSLELIPSVKIIDKIKEWNKRIFLVGFKAADKDMKKKSVKVIKDSSADLVVANDIKNIGSDMNEVVIFDKKGVSKRIKKAEKEIIAEGIVDSIIKRIR